ncbi:MAG: alpha/beta fold hydrolase, partial [candidate division KSB1 bacterium]|nr:alpha/beta fold hydrolase [candidate division KSB1 bacterium]
MKLAFREYGRGEKTLVILHGLLGSAQNWQRVAKELGEKHRILVVDQRNHGESPHHPDHSFAALRDDLGEFFDQQGLQQAYLLGHSMGGVAAMEFAFHHPGRLQGLIVEDIAPRPYHSQAAAILEALSSIKLEGLTARQQVDALLTPHLPNPVIRQFVLTNLVRSADNTFVWRVNLATLRAFQREMASYTAAPTARFTGETLFLGGGDSQYHLDHDESLLLSHFPNSHLLMIPGAGHWIHFDAR